MTLIQVLVVWTFVSVLVGLVVGKFCAFNDTNPSSGEVVDGEPIRG